MQFKIKTSILLSGLIKVSRIISNKSPIPSLNGILFIVNSNDLTLVSSDSDLSIKYKITEDINIVNTGKLVFPKFIVEIIRKIEDEYIDIELIDGNLVLVKSSKSEFKINGMSVESFPAIDFDLKGDKLSMDSLLFKSIINQTIFACSSEEIRPVLTGVNFSCENSIIKAVSTDSFRLSKKEFSYDSNINFNVIIPSKCLNEISKLINDSFDLEINISPQRVIFNFGNIIVQSRLINGLYPDTNRLIPSDFANVLKLDRKKLLNSLERASILSLSYSSNVITLEKNGEFLTLVAKSQEVGSIKETIDFVEYSGNDFVISFNARFMSEAIKSFDSDIINLKFNDAMKPFILRDEDNQSLTQLVLPVKTY